MAHPPLSRPQMARALRLIGNGQDALLLHNASASRALEQALLPSLPHLALMRAAGASIAKLGRSLAPYAQSAWVLCGPGNNGNDGLIAAKHLQEAGLKVFISVFENNRHAPSPERTALLQEACAVGVQTTAQTPAHLTDHDLLIDALLGIGSSRPLNEAGAAWVAAFNLCRGIKLSVDIPSGIDPSSGRPLANDGPWIRAHHTLQLLTAKPGLWMNMGRDAAGQIWLDTLLDADHLARIQALHPPCAVLNRRPAMALLFHPKQHHSHKGSHGDVLVLGGENVSSNGTGMVGAACLAALAALHAGAGRVTCLLTGTDRAQTGAALAGLSPALMVGAPHRANVDAGCWVAGCGGGQSMAEHLPDLLKRCTLLVLDADALNHLAQDRGLQSLLRQRHDKGQGTVLTPHPLEAARLLRTSTSDVQARRIEMAERMAEQWQVTVVLKGCGSVIASPGEQTRINPTGNGSLAAAGTGDVLAGVIGAWLSRGLPPHLAARMAAWQHGRCGEQLSVERPGYSALELARNISIPLQQGTPSWA